MTLDADHPTLAKIITRALGLLSVGLLSPADTDTASHLLDHSNLELLATFTRDAVANLAVRGNASQKEMRRWADLQGQSSLYNTLSKLDIIEASREFKKANNESTEGFPPVIPPGPFQVVDALRLNLQRTPDDHKKIRQLVYEAAEDEKVAHWASMKDKTFESIPYAEEDDEEDEDSDSYETALSSDDDSADTPRNRFRSRQNAALTDDIQSLYREERAVKLGEDVTTASTGHPIDYAYHIHALFDAAYGSVRDEVMYSPRRPVYITLVASIITLGITFICFCILRCFRRSNAPCQTHHHEELQTLDIELKKPSLQHDSLKTE